MIDTNYDFATPLKLVTIFKQPPYKEEQEEEDESPNEELYHELGIKVARRDKTEDWEEISGDVYVRWEDINTIKSYPYKDEFKKFKGDKFYINVEGHGPSYLVFGSIAQILEYWTAYRKKHAKLM